MANLPTSHSAMANGRHEHGKCGGIYDHGTSDKDHESRCAEDCVWHKKIPAIPGICDGVCFFWTGIVVNLLIS